MFQSDPADGCVGLLANNPFLLAGRHLIHTSLLIPEFTGQWVRRFGVVVGNAVTRT